MKLFVLVLLLLLIAVPVSASGEIWSKYDVYQDGIIDIRDISIVAGNQVPRPATQDDHDLTPYPPDGIINYMDLNAVGDRFGCTPTDACYWPSPYDINEDNTIDMTDVVFVKERFGSVFGDNDFSKTFDFDFNGIIDILDINTVIFKLGCTSADLCYYDD